MQLLKINNYSLTINEEIKNILDNYKDNYLPEFKNVFKAYESCSFNDVKVVIIGQDPYQTKGFANGLSFSVEKDIKTPKSLNNIFNSLEKTHGSRPSNGDLTSWSKQGVLLINSVLTVTEGIANSHANKGWEEMTKNVIKDLSNRKKVIFVLLGKYAQQYEKYINIDNNTILKTSHPSPLSVYRGFDDYDLFRKIDENVVKYNYKAIKWIF